MLCLYYCAVATLTYFSNKYVVISNRVLLFEKLLSRHIILRLVLCVNLVRHWSCLASVGLGFVLII